MGQDNDNDKAILATKQVASPSLEELSICTGVVPGISNGPFNRSWVLGSNAMMQIPEVNLSLWWVLI